MSKFETISSKIRYFLSKASELVLGSLTLAWNSMRFFDELTDPVQAKFKHVTNIETCML